MTKKEELINIKKRLLEYKKDIYLDDIKDKDFKDWYKKNYKYLNNNLPKEIEKFPSNNSFNKIERDISKYYEIKYPDEEILHAMFSTNHEININKEEADIYKVLNLNNLEYTYLKNPYPYPKNLFITYFNNFKEIKEVSINLDKDGFVKDSYNFNKLTNNKIKDRDIQNLNLKTISYIFSKNNINEENELLRYINNTINSIEKHRLVQSKILNETNKKIIKRSGDIIGPIRAYLFDNDLNYKTDIVNNYNSINYIKNYKLKINKR